MIERTERRTSVRRRLIVALTAILLALLASAALFAYRGARTAANDAYDRGLLDPALDLAQNVRIESGVPHLDLPPKALEALLYDQSDEAVFQLRTSAGAVIAGEVDLQPSLDVPPGKYRFSDAVYQGAPVRLVTLRTEQGVYIAVAETRHKRNRLVAEILLAELAPTLLIAIASALVAWAAVAHALAPLARLRDELVRRSPADLRPLTDAWAPVEVLPVTAAFNALLAQVRDATAVQQRFVENAAHQLRTPLAGLQMHLELLLRNDLAPLVRTELERLLGATRRASHLTNRLLALAKAESAGEDVASGAQIDLHALVDLSARRWVPRALQSGVDLGFSLAHATVAGDSLLLEELLDNLIDNALLYTPEGGTVTVSCGERDGAPFIQVEDNGRGIPPDERRNVFERFYRIAGTPGHGSGLGLSIVREAAERHGASVEIADAAGGRGTRVTVTFGRPENKSRVPEGAGGGEPNAEASENPYTGASYAARSRN